MPEDWPGNINGLEIFPKRNFPIWWQQLTPISGLEYHQCHRNCHIPSGTVDYATYYWRNEVCPKKFPVVLADIPLKLIVDNCDPKLIEFLKNSENTDLVDFMESLEHTYRLNSHLKPSLVIFKIERIIAPHGPVILLTVKAELIIDHCIQASDLDVFLITDKFYRQARYEHWLYEAHYRIKKLLYYNDSERPLKRVASCEF